MDRSWLRFDPARDRGWRMAATERAWVSARKRDTNFTNWHEKKRAWEPQRAQRTHRFGLFAFSALRALRLSSVLSGEASGGVARSLSSVGTDMLVARAWQPVEEFARWGHRAYRVPEFLENLVGRVPSRGVPCLFQQAASQPPKSRRLLATLIHCRLLTCFNVSKLCIND
jgi:hypothetical protein